MFRKCIQKTFIQKINVKKKKSSKKLEVNTFSSLKPTLFEDKYCEYT